MLVDRLWSWLFAAGLLLFTALCNAQAQPSVAALADAEARCQALARTDFTTVMDAPTRVSEARLVKSAAEVVSGMDGNPPEVIAAFAKALTNMQPFCRVRGYVAPQVGFELALPISNWNGKFLHLGCGGWCGVDTYYLPYCALSTNYACIGTDMGHRGEDGLWVRNNLQGQIDFSYRATHVVTLAGKAIVERYYATSPRRSYFSGCSTGGYQAMVEAQVFPWDFDGIIAGAPDMDESDLSIRGVWLKRNFIGSDGQPVLSDGDLRLLHEAALARCDMDDGVKDGIISDPVHCKFDPVALQCRSGQQTGCLTSAQVQAVRNIYGAPVNSKGQPISTRGVFPGSELIWAREFGYPWGEEFFNDTALLSPQRMERWKVSDFDFDRDYKRSGVGVLFADTNPDLRKFKAAGGKLISYQGGNDATEIPGAIVDYYETVERTMGGRAATQDFFRLFIIPGMDHCWGGDGAFAVDYLAYLDAWVEQGKPPDVMVGAHLERGFGSAGEWGGILTFPLDRSAPVAFARPIYPWPLYAKYKGKGDPTDPSSFESAKP